MDTRNTTARAALLIAGALAATLVLAGCTPEAKPTPTPTASATPTPTPTPTEVAAPQSEDEAIDAATDAVDRYLALETQIFTDPTAPQDIPAVAEGQAAERLQNFSSQMAELGGSGTGAITFEVQSAYTASLGVNGEQVPYGQVNFTGCVDASDLELLKADGTPADQPSVRRYVIQPIAIYRATTESWVVLELPAPEVIEQC
jgi:hypothetical protein